MDVKDALMFAHIGPGGIRLACLALAIEAYPRMARSDGVDKVANEYLEWVTADGAKTAAPAPKPVATVQPPSGQRDMSVDGFDDGAAGEVLEVKTTLESPAGQPASLKQAGGGKK